MKKKEGARAAAPMPAHIVGGYLIADGPALDTPPCDSPSATVRLLEEYRNRDREHFLAVYLNARSQPLLVEVVSIGTLSASLVHPREVFKGAILAGAAAVILAHNHPSGDHSPSPEDKECTRRMVKAGELLGVPVIDHLILGARQAGCFSFRDAGLLS